MKKKIFIILSLLCIILVGAYIFGAKSDRTSMEVKLYSSISHSNLMGLEEVLNAGANLNYEQLSFEETTPFRMKDGRVLALAINNSDDEFVIELIKSGKVNVNSKDEYTYLHEILCNRSVELLNVLLQAGVDIESGKEPAIDNLAYFVHPNLEDKEKRFQIMINNGAQVSSDTMNEMLKNRWRYLYAEDFLQWMIREEVALDLEEGVIAAVLGDDEKLQSLVKDDKVSDKNTVLQFAAANCNTDTLNLMKEKGFDFSIKDSYGMNLLHIASLSNNEDAVQMLLELGVNSCCDEGFSPITYAAIAGNEELIDFLLNHGGTFQNGDNNVWTWAAACSYGSSDSINALLENDYVLDDWDYYAAYQYCNDSVFGALLDQNISYDTTWDGEATIDATKEKYVEILLELGADATIHTLENALEWRNYRVLKDIIHSSKVKVASDDTELLYKAIMLGDYESVELIMASGVDVNEKIVEDDLVTTPLHIAAESPSVNVLKYLLENGANIDAEDSEGRKPYDNAKCMKLKDNMEVLEEFAN